jgi:hypothetical protein
VTDIDDKLLEQQEQEQNERDLQLEAGGNDHDKEVESETPIADEELNQYQKQEQPDRQKQNDDDNERPANGNGTAAEVLVELASENAKLLFKDQYGTAHAEVQIVEHNEIIRIESSRFKRYLARLFYDKVRKKVVNAESIANAIQVLQAKAEYDGPTIPLSLRAAWHGGSICYDLSNDKWQCVEISHEGWEIINGNSPVFVRYNQTPQSNP